MKHIIVPIDFSKESLNGLRLAIIFANQFKSNIQMVYVQKAVSEMGRIGLEEEHRMATQDFAKLIGEYSPKLHEGLELSYIIKKGKVYREVVNQAEAFENTVIICSTHGASGFEEFFIGSNAFKIISATEKPVITIRQGSVPHEIKKIVMPIDITSDTRQKVPITAEIAKAFGAEVHVVAVSTNESDEIVTKLNAFTKQVCDYLKDYEVPFKTVKMNGDNLTDITIEYALDVNADLISIMTEQSLSIANFVLGTYAQQMLNKSPIPVLSVTPQEIFILGSFITQGKPY
ncbi:MAG: universal stress protein [Bacteroidales bacterium]|nr:universal stress protein [Bacteroidales bacterium]